MTTTSPLGGLIRRHRSGRSDAELAEASGRLVSPTQWRELQGPPERDAPPVDPALIAALALALDLTENTVRHDVPASRLPAAR
jgi:hypothetical protein